MSVLDDDDAEAIESHVPGVIEAYARLRAGNDMGIYTSTGAFYNHTFFGRDATMSAKFITDFDHQTARQTIVALAALQGTDYDERTQQQPGRIHHEYRDFREWKGRVSERLVLRLYGLFWGAKDGLIQTYFAADTTANYIRLVNKFCHHIDPSLLDTVVRTQDGRVSIADTVERAAEWIAAQVDQSGCFMSTRASWSLPYQTFQDSVTAYFWADGRAANFRKPHSFTEVQAYAADALLDASRVLSGRSDKANSFKELAHAMRGALFTDYWNTDQNFFTSMLSERDGVVKQLDVPNISAGWTLNTTWWDEMPEHERAAKITAIVNRLFSDEFLTDVGLRTRSKYSAEPLGNAVDYHGSQTVWPMFNFMVIEGLRRHRMYELAEQLERRLVNGTNALQKFPEFYIVDKQGVLCKPSKNRSYEHLKAQMIPEQYIAFTVVPMLAIARRIDAVAPKEPKKWHRILEQDILARIPHVELYDASEASKNLEPRPVHLSRAGTSVRSLVRAYGRIAS